MEFIWDKTKRTSNLKKHGLDFIDAEEVLAGPVVYSPDSNHAEERWIVYGKLKDEIVVLVVTEVEKAGQTTVRVISMRLATNREKHKVEEELSGCAGEYYDNT